MSLPIQQCLDEIISVVSSDHPLVIKAPPGAGKTTGVPLALLDVLDPKDGLTLLVQPRRIAARSAAMRLAHLDRSTLGERVGYQVRFDRRDSSDTELLAVTTGILLRRLLGDPLLESVSTVILDEFHERSIEMDLALGMLHRIRTTFRPELKIVVMSATLDPVPISNFLGDASAVTSEGKSFPVEIRNVDVDRNVSIEQQISDVFPEAVSQSQGHLLVFLPGVGEIRRTKEKLRPFLPPDTEILELYGDLDPKKQDHVIRESRNRKVILATNVAETSITIPGVTGVIDSGLARVMQFDASVGLPRLKLQPISQASADQRAGRAGRTAPGVCWRLWPAKIHSSRPERDQPEIERSDFSFAGLTLASWGERDPYAFPWLSPPPQHHVDAGYQLLLRLQAIDPEHHITAIGRRMVKMPVHCRLARFLIAGSDLGVAKQAALGAALLSERNPFRTRDHANHHGDCDLSDHVDRLQSNRHHDLPGVRQIQRIANDLQRMCDKGSKSPENPRLSFRKALLAAYPDRLARRRGDQSRGRMVGGRGVKISASSSVQDAELFLCIDANSGKNEAMVRMATAVERSWIEESLIVRDEYEYNAELDTVVARRRIRFEDLLIEEHPIACQPNDESARILAGEMQIKIDGLLDKDHPNVVQFLRRVELVSNVEPGISFTRDALLMEALKEICCSRLSKSEVLKAPWMDYLKGRFDYAQLQRIEKQAPERIKIPSGREVDIEYPESGSPFVAVRIQEIFGWKETPRLLAGTSPLQLHLLGPNYRPQQITDDLSSFWATTYQQVRKDLRGRYPKHNWPEDPLTAVATRNGLKPRK